ncbi:MAG: Fe-S cluster assembly sulfur transfer protein SufU [Patescibacteria group bacterium]
MDEQLYRDIILEHWKYPHHYGLITNPTISITKNNPLCGDVITLTAKITEGKISEIGFESEGCAIAKAAASILTDLVEGKTLKEIKKITPEAFLAELAVVLTPSRTKCALLSFSAIKNIH